MAASIKKFLGQPEPIREKTVAYEGEEFILRGRPDTAFYLNLASVTPAQLVTKATHLARVIKSQRESQGIKGDVQILPTHYRQVMMVRHVLVPDEEAIAEGRTQYDETEIARLMVDAPTLFLKLLTAANDVLGYITTEEAKSEMANDPLLRAALGNLPDGERKEFLSSLGLSEFMESLTPSSSGKGGTSKKSSPE